MKQPHSDRRKANVAAQTQVAQIRSFALRVWKERDGKMRFVLADARGGRRFCFSDGEAMMAFLLQATHAVDGKGDDHDD